MVVFVCGKPGGGKSYWATRRVLQELGEGRRCVVTNLPLDVGRVNEYCQERYPDRDCQVVQRLRLIESEDIARWWCYRGRVLAESVGVDVPVPWVTLPAPNEDTGTTDMRASPGPCLYVVDEVHTAFNARCWQKRGLSAIWYLSQHRKMGDEVILISQTPGQVDKQLRSMTQEWLVVRNLRKEKFLQWFTLPQRMMWRSYSNQPGPTEPIMATGMLHLDVEGIGSCYDTAQGNQIAGQTGADKGERAKGVPWYWLVAIPLVLVLGLSQVDRGVKSAVGSLTADPPPRVVSAPTPAPTPAPTQPPQATPPALPAPSQQGTQGAPPSSVDDLRDGSLDGVALVGMVKIGRTHRFYLSNGESYGERECSFYDGHSAIINRTVYRLQGGTATAPTRSGGAGASRLATRHP